LVVSASVHIGQKVGDCERLLRIEQLHIDLADIAGKTHHAIGKKAVPEEETPTEDGEKKWLHFFFGFITLINCSSPMWQTRTRFPVSMHPA
jgi:hypothetical protein